MKYKVGVVKRITLLLMTMALAVAMVACSGAAGTTGPAGPKGDKGDPGEPATTPEPGETPGMMTGPVQILMSIAPLVFHNVGDKMDMLDTDPKMVDLYQHFYPSAGLEFSVKPLSEDAAKRIAPPEIDQGTGMLTVMLMEDAGYEDDSITVEAKNDVNTESIMVKVRRNRPPRVPKARDTDDTAVNATDIRRPGDAAGAAQPISVWVGTQKHKDVKATTKDRTSATAASIPIAIGTTVPKTMYATDDERADVYFIDDPGNELSFEHRPFSTQAERDQLSVAIEGDRVRLRGKKTTTDGTDDTAVGIHLAANDGNFSSDQVHVLDVMIDAAPTPGVPIQTRKIQLAVGATAADVLTVTVRATTKTVGTGHFYDDRQDGVTTTDNDLEIFAWVTDKEDMKIAVVGSNRENKTGADGGAIEDGAITIRGISEGTANITVMAREAKGNADAPAALQQTAMQSFDVVVSFD